MVSDMRLSCAPLCYHHSTKVSVAPTASTVAFLSYFVLFRQYCRSIEGRQSSSLGNLVIVQLGRKTVKCRLIASFLLIHSFFRSFFLAHRPSS